MLRLLILSMALLALTACVKERVDVVIQPGDGETRTICDVDSLDTRVAVIRKQSGAARETLSGGRGDDEFVDVERTYQLRDRLNRFDAEVDIQHRNLTASCRAYARCMEMQGHVEQNCSASLGQWQNAQSGFENLTLELKKIEAQIAMSHGGRGGRRYDVNRCDAGGRNCDIGRFDY